MSIVSIDWDNGTHGGRGWWFFDGQWVDNANGDREYIYRMKDPRRFDTFPQVKRAAIAAGHEVFSAGWKHKMLSWNWHMHVMDGYAEWEAARRDDRGRTIPAFVKLSHVRRSDKADVESNVLCNAWDDVATVDFYQRDWTDDALPFVNDGDTYWSGWWFQTIAERDRFVAWLETQPKDVRGTVCT